MLNRIIRMMALAAIALGACVSCKSGSYKVVSPDGKLVMAIGRERNGELTYTFTADGTCHGRRYADAEAGAGRRSVPEVCERMRRQPSVAAGLFRVNLIKFAVN